VVGVTEGSAPAFGELLRRHRLAAGFSQEQLAERARVSLDAVSALERGIRRSPQRQTLALLSEALALDAREQAELESAAQRNRARSRPVGESPAAFAGATLPIYLTSFVGRETELAELVDVVREHRLVTVVGTGGIGKTRLACAAAGLLEDAFARVAFIDLAGVINPRLLLLQIASTLSIEAQPQNAAERIGRALGRARTLLIFDNCEHVIEPITLLTAELLQSSLELHVLATSRERLGMNGEHVCRLQPLTPAPALELFVARAQNGDRHFVLSEATAPAARDVVRRLEGIPLAIELTVARLPALGLPELRHRLDRLFMLPGANRAAPARQQTMQATIAWSYGLLGAQEQIVFARLAIFVGDFSLDAAETVCSCRIIAADAVATSLQQLVEQSILQIIPGEAPRYRLLEPVRLYGLERLVEGGAYALLVRRHALWLAEIADAADAEIARGITRSIALGMVPDIDNIRAALDRLLSGGDVDELMLAARIAGGLRTLWISLGAGHAEGERWSEQILAGLNQEQYPELYGRVLRLYFQTAQSGEKELAALQRAIAFFSAAGDRVVLAHVYAHTIQVLTQIGDRESADRWVEESRAMLDDDASVEPNAYAFLAGAHAFFHALEGDFPRAHADLALAERILGKAGEFDWTLSTIKADIAAQEGHYERAVEIAEAGVAHWPPGYAWSRLLTENTIASYRFLAGDLVAAASAVRDILGAVLSGMIEDFVFDEVVGVAAAIVAAQGSVEVAARLGAYTDACDAWRLLYRGSGLVRARLETVLASALGSEQRASLAAEGRRLTQTEAIQIALEALRDRENTD
jgi:predicted ATPase/DNA-binding XRE family transcriptional regulator